MHFTHFLGIFGFLATVSSIPLATSGLEDLDILVPGPNNTLVRPSVPPEFPAPPKTLHRRDCSIKSGNQVSWQYGDGGYYCANYCEHSAATITGGSIAVSADIDCTTGCSTAHAYAVTISSSFTINAGLSFSAGEATLSAGASWQFQNSLSSTNTYTFNPANGDVGHIVFKPYFRKSCGELTNYDVSDVNYDVGIVNCLNNVIGHDPNACGQVPLALSSGEANGIYSFCNIKTGRGC